MPTDKRVDQFSQASLPLRLTDVLPIIPGTVPIAQPVDPTTTGIIAMQTNVGDLYNKMIGDTGWKNLQGFTWITAPGLIPQYRIIGRAMYFRGSIIVPLGAGAPTTFAGEVSYASLTTSTPAPGGVVNTNAGVVVVGGSSPSGGLQMNLGSSVIQPGDPLPDGGYQIASVVGFRRSFATADAVNTIPYTGIFNIAITSSGVLTVQTGVDLENGGGTLPTGTLIGSSMYRFLNSKTNTGDFALDYQVINANGTLQGSTAATAQTVVIPRLSGNPTHAVTLDASDAALIGGFIIPINNLIAYLAPLT